jgi:hypothetical protein
LSHYAARQKITLASGSLRKQLPIDEEPEPESDYGPETPEAS